MHLQSWLWQCQVCSLPSLPSLPPVPGPGCGRSGVATTRTPQVSALSGHISVKTPFFAGLRGGGDEPVENLLWTGKTKRFTGAAVGNNREETTYPPTQIQTTQTGAPTQPLQRWWDAPGGVGRWERGQKQRKAFMEYKQSFPLHHKQALTTPSRVFPSYPAFCHTPVQKSGIP